MSLRHDRKGTKRWGGAELLIATEAPEPIKDTYRARQLPGVRIPVAGWVSIQIKGPEAGLFVWLFFGPA